MVDNLNPDIWNGDYYRLFVSALLHGAWFHVIIDNIALYSLGRLLEQLLGSTAFFMLYILALLAGNVASLHLGSSHGRVSGVIWGNYGAGRRLVCSAATGSKRQVSDHTTHWSIYVFCSGLVQSGDR